MLERLTLNLIERQGVFVLTANNQEKRLALFRKTVGLSQRDLAASLGFSPGLVGSIESGAIEPSRNFLRRISEAYNVSADWLLEGREPMLHVAQRTFESRYGTIGRPDNARPLAGDVRIGDEEYALVKRYDVNVSAGPGLVPVEEGVDGALAFSRSWLIRNGVSADLSGLVRVRGDSMAPTIPDGALALVNAAEMEVRKEGIYAYSRHGEAYIKRLTSIGKNTAGKLTSLAVVSDNPTFQPEIIAHEDLRSIRIIGRVVWVGHDLK